MPQLDETALRRPGFRDGPKVKLADGQAWTFPRPRFRLYPSRDPETGRIGAGGGATFGADFERCLDDLAETTAEDTLQRFSLQFEMASILLLQNYDLGDDDLASLLVTDLDEPASSEMWATILPIMTGQAPKPSPDGSATP